MLVLQLERKTCTKNYCTEQNFGEKSHSSATAASFTIKSPLYYAMYSCMLFSSGCHTTTIVVILGLFPLPGAGFANVFHFLGSCYSIHSILNNVFIGGYSGMLRTFFQK